MVAVLRVSRLRTLLGTGRLIVVPALVIAVVTAGCGNGVDVKTMVTQFTQRNVRACAKLSFAKEGRRIYECEFANGDHRCYTVDQENSPEVTEVFGIGTCPFEPPESEVPGSGD